MAVIFKSDVEIKELLKKYFEGLALHWQEEDCCLVDDYIDLARLTKFLYSKGTEGIQQ